MDTTSPPAPLNEQTPRPWLRRFCYLTILATFTLIAIGGYVTSNDVGLAVPDGFTTFGHFTLLAPIQDWWYDFGTRWEHSHRLKGNLVGMMSITMALWLLYTYRDQAKYNRDRERYGRVFAWLCLVTYAGQRPWLRWSGVVMLALVINQGIMGALRVSEVSLTLAFVHGIVGQLILCSWVVIAAALGRPWIERLGAIAGAEKSHVLTKLRWAARLLLIALLVQLTLGSAVRHFKADKSPPDMLVYGQVLPPMSQEALDRAYTEYYADQMGTSPEASGVTNRNPFGDVVVSVGDVHLQLAHRVGAFVVLVIGLGVIVWAIRRAGIRSVILAPALILAMLLGTQIALGVMTVLSGTDPMLATLHQATGAALIAVATWLTVRIHLAEYAAKPVMADDTSGAVPSGARPPALAATPA